VGSGPREGDNRRRVNWEIDDKDTYLSDVEEERVYIMENKDSAGWDKNRREKDQIYNIQTKIKFSNKNDKNSTLNENLGNNSHYLELRVREAKGDPVAIQKLELKKDQRKKYAQKYRNALKEKAAKGDPVAIQKLERIKDQLKKHVQKYRNALKEKAAKGDPVAIQKLERIKDQLKKNTQKYQNALKEKR
jgi:hypothetical protein